MLAFFFLVMATDSGGSPSCLSTQHLLHLLFHLWFLFSSPLWVVGLRRGEWVAQVLGSCLHQTLDKTPNLFIQILPKPVRNTKFDPIQTTNRGFRVPYIVQFVLGFILMAQLNWAKDNQRFVYRITLNLAFSVEMCHVPLALKYEEYLDGLGFSSFLFSSSSILSFHIFYFIFFFL